MVAHHFYAPWLTMLWFYIHFATFYALSRAHWSVKSYIWVMNNIYVKLAVVFIILILLYIRRRENKGILLPILFIVITVSVLYYFRNTLQIGQFFTLQ